MNLESSALCKFDTNLPGVPIGGRCENLLRMIGQNTLSRAQMRLSVMLPAQAHQNGDAEMMFNGRSHDKLPGAVPGLGAE